nr:hypothetical protein [Nitrosomonas nitrosa]
MAGIAGRHSQDNRRAPAAGASALDSILPPGKLNVRPHFDRLQFRLARDPSPERMEFLRSNCAPGLRKREERAFCADGKGHQGVMRSRPRMLVVVAPNRRALEWLCAQRSMICNGAEIAVEIEMPRENARRLSAFFLQCLVQPWHRGRVSADEWGKVDVLEVGEGGYTKRRSARRNIGFYPDKPSKFSGRECFKYEHKLNGLEAMRSVLIESSANLLSFDHAAHWQKHLTLFEVDIERLGRLELNRSEPKPGRRKKPAPILAFKWSADAAVGRFVMGRDGRNVQGILQAQALVDRIGRGPFLRAVDTSRIRPA